MNSTYTAAGEREFAIAESDCGEGSSETAEPIQDIDANVLKRGKNCLGLTVDYVTNWTRREAFRELYQNWKDAILTSFNLGQREIQPVVCDDADKIEVTVHGVDGDLLGFIRFNKTKGDLELANFGAKLQALHLRLGSTSKRDHKDLAGVHGEGLKLAALVMEREDHHIKIVSDSFHWDFRLTGPTLHCDLRPVAPLHLERARKVAESENNGRRRHPVAYPWEDVVVAVGQMGRSKKRPIAEHDFRSWLSHVLELRPPAPATVLTAGAVGDLILDENYSGWVHLKGLRIASYGSNYRFGYNLLQGRVGRDRESLVNEDEEGGILTSIWSEVIHRHGAPAIDAYLSLFEDEKIYSELPLIQNRMSPSTAKIVWRHLRRRSPGVFFHPESDHPESILVYEMMTREEFHKEPRLLRRPLWDFFKRNGVGIRTPLSEQRTLFLGSSEIDPPGHAFGRHVHRMALAAMQLHPKTSSVQVRFVNGGGTRLDADFDPQRKCLKVHQKWIDFDDIHSDSSCEFVRFRPADMAPEEGFFCDHVVRDLLIAIACRLCPLVGMTGNESLAWSRNAQERIERIPRQIAVVPTHRAGELAVSWVGNENGMIARHYDDDIRYHVTLHKNSTCTAKSSSLLHKRDPHAYSPTFEQTLVNLSDAIEDVCDCPHQIVPRRVSCALFKDLDPKEHYFALVARDEEISIAGVSSHLCAPRSVSDPAGVTTSSLETTLAEKGCEHCRIKGHEVSPRLANGKCCESRRSLAGAKFDGTAASTTDQSLAQGMLSPDEGWQSVLQADAEERQTWYREELPGLFARLSPAPMSGKLECHRKARELMLHKGGTKFGDGRIWNIKVNQYYHLRLRTDRFADCVVLVRDICFSSTQPNLGSAYLLATRYSIRHGPRLLGPVNPLDRKDERPFSGDTELLLHYRDADGMGERDDAEVIPLEEVEGFQRLHTPGVQHVMTVPPSNGSVRVFCRYAIRTVTDARDACIMPLSSTMLGRHTSEHEPPYVTGRPPVVFDFTPGALGAEGLAQAGMKIGAACGFDPEKHVSWKIRFPDSHVYDGAPLEPPSRDGEARTLLSDAETTAPRIALASGGEWLFRDHDRPVGTQSAIDAMATALRSGGDFVFYVLLVPPTILRDPGDALDSLLQQFLERRLSVQLRLISLAELGLPQSREVLCVVASPFRSALPLSSPALGDRQGPGSARTVGLFIRDLQFSNPGRVDQPSSGWVCPATKDQDHPDGKAFKDAHRKLVYNHQTGRAPGTSQTVTLSMDDTEVRLGPGAYNWLVHPVRGDLVTARELARMQGFGDGIAFYGSPCLQFETVIAAMPPVVTRHIGRAILELCQRSQVVAIDDSGAPAPTTIVPSGPRRRKRARTESATWEMNGHVQFGSTEFGSMQAGGPIDSGPVQSRDVIAC